MLTCYSSRHASGCRCNLTEAPIFRTSQRPAEEATMGHASEYEHLHEDAAAAAAIAGEAYMGAGAERPAMEYTGSQEPPEEGPESDSDREAGLVAEGDAIADRYYDEHGG